MAHKLSRWRAAIVASCSLLLSILFVALPAISSSFVEAPDVAWANPNVRTLKDLGPNSPLTNLGRDYDCATLSYIMQDDLSRETHQGCFSSVAFGLIEYSTGIVILNGANGAEQLLYNGQIPALQPFPYSTALLRFGGFPPSGTYAYVTSYFPSAYHIVRDALLRPHLELDLSHELPLRDSAGRLLAINPLALAFSGRGEWLVTESPDHALIRMNTATYDILPFAPAFRAAGFPYASYSAGMAITQDGRYAGYASAQLSQLKIYDLATCAATTSPDPLNPDSCQSYDYWPYLSQALGGSVSRVSNLSFIGDGVLKFTATASGQRHDYELAPAASIGSLIPYLGLGDSYSSGEGAGNYRFGTDDAVNHCHNSIKAYPLRLSADEFGGSGQSVACSGATTHDVTDGSNHYTGQVSDHRDAQARRLDGSATIILHNFMPGFLAQRDFVAASQPAVITVGISGNDVGFSDMLVRCISPLNRAGHPNPNTCFTSYEDRLEVEQTMNRAYAKLTALYQGLLKQDPAGRIYAVGYPQIVAASGSCALNVHMNPGDISFTRNSTDYLNGVIERAAHAAGVTYVDISQALEGYELCQAHGNTAAMNGLTAGNDEMGVLSKGSYHPTAFGQELIEQSILQATNHFHVTPPAGPDNAVVPPQESAVDPLLQAPKTGRPVRTVVPAHILTTGKTAVGGTLAISVDGTLVSLAPSSSFTVIIGAAATGTLNSDASGNIAGSVTVPQGIDPGVEPVSVEGPGGSGDPVDVTEPVYIGVTADDTDGDGIPDAQDRCPGVQNSGIDADNDGLDDACDSDTSVATTPDSPKPDQQPPAGNGDSHANAATPNSSSPPSQSNNIVQPGGSASQLQQSSPFTNQVVSPPHLTRLTRQQTPRVRSQPARTIQLPAKRSAAASIAGSALPYFRWYLWLAAAVLATIAGQRLYHLAAQHPNHGRPASAYRKLRPLGGPE